MPWPTGESVRGNLDPDGEGATLLSVQRQHYDSDSDVTVVCRIVGWEGVAQLVTGRHEETLVGGGLVGEDTVLWAGRDLTEAWASPLGRPDLGVRLTWDEPLVGMAAECTSAIAAPRVIEDEAVAR